MTADERKKERSQYERTWHSASSADCQRIGNIRNDLFDISSSVIFSEKRHLVQDGDSRHGKRETKDGKMTTKTEDDMICPYQTNHEAIRSTQQRSLVRVIHSFTRPCTNNKRQCFKLFLRKRSNKCGHLQTLCKGFFIGLQLKMSRPVALFYATQAGGVLTCCSRKKFRGRNTRTGSPL